jgi:hypothetical protein
MAEGIADQVHTIAILACAAAFGAGQDVERRAAVEVISEFTCQPLVRRGADFEPGSSAPGLGFGEPRNTQLGPRLIF